MIGLLAVAGYIPDGRLRNADRYDEFGIDDAFISGKLGVREVSRKGAAEETSDMCVQAFEKLKSTTGISPRDVDCIVVCTQNPDGRGLPHTSAIVQHKIGASEECAAFDISLGCSGYVYGLSILQGFLSANGMRRGILFTADPYSKIIDPGDKNTVLLFGDGATASLVAEGGPEAAVWRASTFRYATRGSEGAALRHDGTRLVMNGRAVFNFCATAVPQEILGLLEKSGLTEADVDCLVLHQGSKYIVDTIRRRLGWPESKVPLRLGSHGNTVSSSIPLVLEMVLTDDVDRIILCGFGVGLSVAACLLIRTQGDGIGAEIRS